MGMLPPLATLKFTAAGAIVAAGSEECSCKSCARTDMGGGPLHPEVPEMRETPEAQVATVARVAGSKSKALNPPCPYCPSLFEQVARSTGVRRG